MKKRILANLFTTRGSLRRAFPTPVLDAIEEAIRRSELQHTGELRFAVETALDLPTLLRGVRARDRAVETFSSLRTWDTAENNGVLIYVLLAEHDIEIVADRGYNDRVDQHQWQSICNLMEQQFHDGHFERGSVEGIERITDIIRQYYPARDDDSNELPDRPVLL